MKKLFLNKKALIFTFSIVSITTLTVLPFTINPSNSLEEVQTLDEKEEPISQKTENVGFVDGVVYSVSENGVNYSVDVNTTSSFFAPGTYDFELKKAFTTSGLGGTTVAAIDLIPTVSKTGVVMPGTGVVTIGGPTNDVQEFSVSVATGTTLRLTADTMQSGALVSRAMLIDVKVGGFDSNSSISLAMNGHQLEATVNSYVAPEAYWYLDYLMDPTTTSIMDPNWSATYDVKIIDTTTFATYDSTLASDPVNDPTSQMINPFVVNNAVTTGTPVVYDIYINNQHGYQMIVDSNSDGVFDEVIDETATVAEGAAPAEVSLTFVDFSTEVTSTSATIDYTWTGTNSQVIYWELYELSDTPETDIETETINWATQIDSGRIDVIAPSFTGTINSSILTPSKNYVLITTYEGSQDINQANYDLWAAAGETPSTFSEIRFRTDGYFNTVAPKIVTTGDGIYGTDGKALQSVKMEYTNNGTEINGLPYTWWIVEGQTTTVKPVQADLGTGVTGTETLPKIIESTADTLKVGTDYTFYLTSSPNLPSDAAYSTEFLWSQGNTMTLFEDTVRYDFTTDKSIYNLAFSATRDAGHGYSYATMKYNWGTSTPSDFTLWFDSTMNNSLDMGTATPATYSETYTIEDSTNVLTKLTSEAGVILDSGTQYEVYYQYGTSQAGDMIVNPTTPVIFQTASGLESVAISADQTDGSGNPLIPTSLKVDYVWDTEELGAIYYYIDQTPTNGTIDGGAWLPTTVTSTNTNGTFQIDGIPAGKETRIYFSIYPDGQPDGVRPNLYLDWDAGNYLQTVTPSADPAITYTTFDYVTYADPIPDDKTTVYWWIQESIYDGTDPANTVVSGSEATVQGGGTIDSSNGTGKLKAETTYKIYMSNESQPIGGGVMPDGTIESATFTTDSGINTVAFDPLTSNGYQYVDITYGWNSQEGATVYYQIKDIDTGKIIDQTDDNIIDSWVQAPGIVNAPDGHLILTDLYEESNWEITYSMFDFIADPLAPKYTISATTDMALQVSAPEAVDIGTTTAKVPYTWHSSEAWDIPNFPIYYRVKQDTNGNQIQDTTETYDAWQQVDAIDESNMKLSISGLTSNGTSWVQFSFDEENILLGNPNVRLISNLPDDLTNNDGPSLKIETTNGTDNIIIMGYSENDVNISYKWTLPINGISKLGIYSGASSTPPDPLVDVPIFTGYHETIGIPEGSTNSFWLLNDVTTYWHDGSAYSSTFVPTLTAGQTYWLMVGVDWLKINIPTS